LVRIGDGIIATPFGRRLRHQGEEYLKTENKRLGRKGTVLPGQGKAGSAIQISKWKLVLVNDVVGRDRHNLRGIKFKQGKGIIHRKEGDRSFCGAVVLYAGI